MFDAFYSDPHFGHSNIISFCSRPFQSVEHMEEELIARYNECVPSDGHVLWVGDCFFTSIPHAQKIMRALNGKKTLVRGNHDRTEKQMLGIGFDLVTDALYFRLGSYNIRAVHYPYRVGARKDDNRPFRFPEKRADTILMHGHTHSAEKYSDQAVHVGVDAWDYRPATADQVLGVLNSAATVGGG